MIKFSKSRLAVSASIVVLSTALVVASPSFAAGDTATLQGRAAPGSKVTATDTNTGQKVTVTAGANGTYIIVGLRPSAYHVTSGSIAEDITLAVGETSLLDLDAGQGTTTVTVVGRRSKEVRTSEIGTSLSTTQIENLPQNDRNFLNFAALAPGVSVSNGNKTFQAGGVGPDQVNVFIDGQSFKNQSSHGGVAGQAFSPGNPFPQLAVQEFKVSSQNFPAEFDQSGSAIITAVTKTGGTDFHGTFFTQYQNKDMTGRPYFDRPGNANNPNGTNPKPDYKRYQYGADIGGPIIKNVLHFYAAAEVLDQTSPSISVNVGSATPSSVATAVNGSFPTTFKQTLLFGKLTWFATDADKVDFSIFNRDEDNLIDFGGNRAVTGARNVTGTTKNIQAEWTHRADTYLNEFSVAYQDASTQTPVKNPGPQYTLQTSSAGGDQAILGGNNFSQQSGQKLWTIKNNITFNSFDWHGSHVIKAGAKITTGDLSRNESSNVYGTYYYVASTYTGTAADPGSSVPFKADINLSPPTTFTSSNTQVGLFIQDTWQVGDHWTYNLGVRWDYETNAMNNKFVTPTEVATALRNYANWKAAGINAEDYISNGHNRDAYTGAFAPRLGVSYDVYGDRSLIFFGGWGRYYDRDTYLSGQIESVTQTNQKVITQGFYGAGTGNTLVDANNDGKDDRGYIQWQAAYSDPAKLRAAVAATGVGGSVWALNNKTKTPYSDNLTIGFRKRLGAATLSVSAQHNMSYNVFQYVRGNRLPDGTYTSKGDGWTEDTFPASGILPGYSGKLNIGASDGKSRYNALFVTVDKPFTRASKYGYTAALTLADSKSNGSELGSDEFFGGPSQSTFGYNSSLGVDKMRFVGTGIVLGPWDTTISATLTLASGQPFGSVDGTQAAPENACCIVNLGGVYFPKDKLSYQQLDMRIAKDFELPNGNIITLDGQVYNLFDHVNRAYSAWGAGANWGGGPALKENSTQGPARTFQVGLKYKW
ncbi:hypothetical protein AEAC466_10480 [Asticcacaulis sp. AC466]|uniref:TonB-dependent receptor n=1 Tax=Asticcacaulis sp. AC466 TaxID=1282362 RepID=UPI0003C3B18C|nr:TonB-dependent receptor [Asticcacaulis sp. AC466]ESQ84164.1 hypothetical protein AEAC466_10480 [Asticcacaulis sp. AC466]